MHMQLAMCSFLAFSSLITSASSDQLKPTILMILWKCIGPDSEFSKYSVWSGNLLLWISVAVASSLICVSFIFVQMKTGMTTSSWALSHAMKTWLQAVTSLMGSVNVTVYEHATTHLSSLARKPVRQPCRRLKVPLISSFSLSFLSVYFQRETDLYLHVRVFLQ